MGDENEEFELCISLDNDGRTNFNNPDACMNGTLDYSTKATELLDLSSLDELLMDCEVADCALLPRTFWVPSNGEPRCSLERMALDVFHHHLESANTLGLQYDERLSGAEWWVQVRPSAKSGRYSVLLGDNNDDDNGICFHWDKDEELRLMTGMFIHPHLSTVSYLTDIGAPTIVFDKRVDYSNGSHIYMDQSEASEAFCSWPKIGKHLSFDGRLLHAAPSDLMPKGLFKKQCSSQVDNTADTSIQNAIERRHKRITFLVNIWINHRPLGINPFPEAMIDKMSKYEQVLSKNSIFENSRSGKVLGHVITASNGGSDEVIGEISNFSWLLAGYEATGVNEAELNVSLPIRLIQNEIKSGGNLRLTWPAATLDEKAPRVSYVNESIHT